MSRDFEIDGSLYFREKGLQSKTTPNHSFVPQSDILAAIRAFLRGCPLGKPSRTNRNLVFRSPGEASGTVVLPLWTQSASFNPISPQWSSFISLLDALRPLLEVVGRMFKSIRPYDYAYAENVFLSDIWMSDPPVHRIPGRRPSSADCFSSLRLSANLALTPGACESESSGSPGASKSVRGEMGDDDICGRGQA